MTIKDLVAGGRGWGWEFGLLFLYCNGGNHSTIKGYGVVHGGESHLWALVCLGDHWLQDWIGLLNLGLIWAHLGFNEAQIELWVGPNLGKISQA